MRDVGTSAALAVAVALGLWPYLETVDFAPMALDSVLWISRGALHQPNWPEWTFWTRHFNVGYRPIAALSFTLTHAVAGLAVAAYRSTDLALHAANGLLVFAVVRRLAPGLPKWSAWLSASVFLMHPATEEVVPWLAR